MKNIRRIIEINTNGNSIDNLKFFYNSQYNKVISEPNFFFSFCIIAFNH